MLRASVLIAHHNSGRGARRWVRGDRREARGIGIHQQFIEPREARRPRVVGKDALPGATAHAFSDSRIHDGEYLCCEGGCIVGDFQLDTRPRAEHPRGGGSDDDGSGHGHRLENLVLDTARHPQRSDHRASMAKVGAYVVHPARDADCRVVF